MFGFLRAPCRSCLGESANDYRGYFCGLANALQKDYGWPARFLVNRDSTFLSLLTASQSPGAPDRSFGTCCNPLGSCRTLYQSDDHARYAAAITICGLATKVRDDEEDHTGWRSAGMKNVGHLIEGWRKRATATLDHFDFPTARVNRILLDQTRIEREVRQGSRQPWEAAEPTARAFGEIFRHTSIIGGKAANAPALIGAGSALGKVIYLLDAARDLAKDRDRGHFNPLAIGDRAPCGSILADSLTQLESYAGRLQFHRSSDLIRHILVDGVEATATVFDDDPNRIETQKKGARKKRKGRSGKRKERKRDQCCDCCYCCPSPSRSNSACDCNPCDGDCCGCDCG